MNRLSRVADAAISQSALRNMHLAFDRARKRNAFPPWASRGWKYKRQFLKLYRKAATKNYYCKSHNGEGDRWHVDHIVPLAGEHVCGLMVPWNLHVIPAVTNMAKGTMVVDEWINRDFEAERRTANAARLERERINREKWKAESEYWGEKTRQRRARYGR